MKLFRIQSLKKESLWYSFDGKFGLIVSDQKDSPLGKTWNQYLDESEAKLVDENPVFKLIFFTFKGIR